MYVDQVNGKWLDLGESEEGRVSNLSPACLPPVSRRSPPKRWLKVEA